MTWWTDGAILGSLFFGVVGHLSSSFAGVGSNLAASAIWDGSKFAAKPVVAKISSLLAQSASQGNHDLLRALRRAECHALVALCDEALRDDFNFRGDRLQVTERLALWLRKEPSADLAALCCIRRAFSTMQDDLRTASVDDLKGVHGAAIADVPMLVKAGSECFESHDVDAMRERVVAQQMAALDHAVRSDPATVGLISADGGPLAPMGLPPGLVDRMTRHPKGWWEYLLLAFREELKDPANGRARAAWQFDVLNQLPQQLGATYEQFDARFSALESQGSSTWTELTALRQQSNQSTLVILDLLQQTLETTDGTRVAVKELHHLSESGFADIKTMLTGLIEGRPGATATLPSAPLVDYCRHLETVLARTRPLGTDGQHTWSADVTLEQVYVDLDTKRRNKVVDDDATPLSVFEAVARHKQLVLLGDAGSGKSTFVTHLARHLASRAVRPAPRLETTRMGWLRDGDIPIRIVLRDFAAWRASNAARPHSGDILAFIHDLLHSEHLGHAWNDLTRRLDDGRAIVLFDGLDEIPDATARARTRDAIGHFTATYPRSGCVVTCRVLAYDDHGMGFDQWPSFLIAPLTDAKIDGFIRAWFGGRTGGDTDDETNARAARLKTDLARSDLKELASNPLLLTAVTILSTRGERPLDSRPRLYRDAITLLLWQWDAGKATSSERADSALQALIEEAGWDVGRLERVLAQVAYEAQEGTGTRDNQIVADILEYRLLRRLREERGGSGQHLDWASRIVSQLKERTGLLVQRAPDVLAFPHRMFQEYLAGRYLSNSRNFASRASRLLQDGNYWLRTVLLSVGHSVHVDGELDSPLFLLNRLCPEVPGGDERAWRNVWFAGEALAEFGVDQALSDDYGSVVVNRVKQGLVALVEGNHLTPGDRAKAAAVLGRIGDPRFRPDRWHLPADEMLGFVSVGAGPFTMGSDQGIDQDAYDHELPQHTVELPAFFIAKWPVTVAQFNAFVDDELNGGFSPSDPQCLRGIPNHPVTQITWTEAVAYCRWLTDRLLESDAIPAALSAHLRGARPWTVTLPSEAEWEKAARGSRATMFPWGDDVTRDKAHYGEPDAEQSTAVGCFPAGRSELGVEDLAGNVWECTRSLWGAEREFPRFTYPYRPDYTGVERENLQAAPEMLRVVRGGAGELDPRQIRTAYRFWLGPHQRGRNVGFRVVLSPFAGRANT